MKTFYMFACWSIACIFLASNSSAIENRIKLYSEIRRNGATNEWVIPLSRLKVVPKWQPIQEDVPLPLNKALQIATKWVMGRERMSEPNLDIDVVIISSLHSDEKDFRDFYFYRITFGVRPFDRVSCIVLMDGTVLEPQPHLNATR